MMMVGTHGPVRDALSRCVRMNDAEPTNRAREPHMMLELRAEIASSCFDYIQLRQRRAVQGGRRR